MDCAHVAVFSMPVTSEDAGAPSGRAAKRPNLVARLVRQDRDAWDEAFARYGPAILGLIRDAIRTRNWHLLRDCEEDLLADTFVRALKHIESFRGRDEASLLNYLRKVAISVCISELRKARLREVSVENIFDWPQPESSGVSEFSAMVREAVDEIEPDLRVVIILTMHGFTWKEIVEKLGIPAKEFWRRKYKAFEILRQRLTEPGCRPSRNEPS